MRSLTQAIAIFGLIFFLGSCGSASKTEESEESVVYETTGSVERLDPRINDVIPDSAKIEILTSGYSWVEGPVWAEEINSLLFSDVPENTIYKWNEEDSASVYLKPSGYLGDIKPQRRWEMGSNGLYITKEGELILCQCGDRRLAKMLAPLSDPKPEYETIAGSYDGKLFNSPNDVTRAANGTYFFTDPPYGLRTQEIKELDFQGVYKVDPEGNLSLLIDSLSFPNGVALSPDEKILYVAVSNPGKAINYAYDLDENQNIVSGRTLLDITSLQGRGRPGAPDGMEVNKDGIIFTTGAGGVIIIHPDGTHLGTIRTDKHTSNVAFNTDESVLYITASNQILRVKL